MDVEDAEEEVRRLRAQVAEMQHERADRQEAEESRAKKGSDSLDATFGFCPRFIPELLEARSASEVIADSCRCRRFYIERSSQRVALQSFSEGCAGGAFHHL